MEASCRLANVDYETAYVLQSVKDLFEDILNGAQSSAYDTKLKKALNELDKLKEKNFKIESERLKEIQSSAGPVVTLDYENGFLKSMTNPFEDGKKINYSYDKNGYLIAIEHPDGIKAVYTYDNGTLTSVEDEKGERIKYSYWRNKIAGKKSPNTGKIGRITEGFKKSKDSNKYVAGQQIGCDYSDYNKTAFMYSGRDDKFGNADDYENIYCFDNSGRTISVYSRDAKTKKVYGGNNYTYTGSEEGEDSANKIKASVMTGTPVINYAQDSGFEKRHDKNKLVWECDEECEKEIDISNNKQKYMGMRSACIKKSLESGKNPMIYQDIYVPSTGIYTASVYVKAQKMTNAKAVLKLSSNNYSVESESKETEDGEDDNTDDEIDDDSDEYEDDDEAEDSDPEDADEEVNPQEGSLDENTPAEIQNGWRRIEASINVKNTKEPVRLTLGLQGDSGEIWFDCVQLEKSSLANQYNLLPNSGFEGKTSKSKKGNVEPDEWWYAQSSGEVDAQIVNSNVLGKDNKVIEGKQAFCIKGNEAQKKGSSGVMVG